MLTRIPTIGAFAGYFGETHDRYNREWFDEIIANKVLIIKLRTREVALKLSSPALAGEKYKISPIDGRAGSIYPTHHQKMILVDYETPERAVGYVMGHNSTTDFWDTATHRFQDPRRETLYKTNPAEAIGKLTVTIDEAQDWYERQMRSMSGQPEQPSRRKAERLINSQKRPKLLCTRVTAVPRGISANTAAARDGFSRCPGFCRACNNPAQAAPDIHAIVTAIRYYFFKQ